MPTARRQHIDVLIAGLILVGATTCLRTVTFEFVEPGLMVRCTATGIAAFAATHVVRRLLPEVTAGQLITAAIVTLAVLLGTFLQRDEETLAVTMLIPTGFAALGAFVGAITSRRRADPGARFWRVLGGGLGGYGATILASCLALMTDVDGLAIASAVIAACTGCLIIVMFTNVRSQDTALGLGLVYAAVTAPRGGDDWAVNASMAMFLGALLGAIGGAIGARIAESRGPQPELPDARVRQE